ncbi:MAG: hypothetical protein ABW076_06415 [Candidatus Thiodiazotropha sp.]
MQINSSLPSPYLPVTLDQQRQVTSPVGAPQPLNSAAQQESAVRSVENMRQAEQVLRRQASARRFQQVLEDPRSQRALKSYEAVQSGQERDYVSAVLGIDVYA